MQQDLSKLTRELRKETCPRRVLDEVERQISQKESAPSHLRLALCAVACVVLAGCFSVWLWHGNESARTLAEHPKPDSAQVANQAEIALTLTGSILLNASAHSETIISNRAVPPLRNSIEIARNKIIHHGEL